MDGTDGIMVDVHALDGGILRKFVQAFIRGYIGRRRIRPGVAVGGAIDGANREPATSPRRFV